MHLKKRSLYTASLMACCSIPFTASAAESSFSEASSPHPDYRPLQLNLEGGTTGLGGSVGWRFADHFGARAGLDFLQYTDNGFVIKGVEYDAKIRLMSEPLTLDYYPWKKSSFHISLGVQFNQNRLTGTANDTGNIFPPEQVGMVNLEIKQQPVNPYLSIGGNFFYFDSAHHWSLGGELGVAYTGDPKVDLSTASSSPFRDAVTQYGETPVKDYAEKFRWWPIVKLMVSYSF